MIVRPEDTGMLRTSVDELRADKAALDRRVNAAHTRYLRSCANAQRAVDRVPIYRPAYATWLFQAEAGTVVGMFIARAHKRMIEEMAVRVENAETLRG